MRATQGLVAGAILAAGAIASAGVVATAATSLTPQEKRGEAVLERLCAGCHAVGRSGTSRHQGAPTFRTLGRRYAIESLEEALGEGIMSGHPDMPEFKLEPHEIGAVIAYLRVIQEP
jgi:cytochrome c